MSVGKKKSKEKRAGAFQKPLSWLRFQCWTLFSAFFFYLCWKKKKSWFCLVQVPKSPRGSVFVPLFYSLSFSCCCCCVFWRELSPSCPGWMATLCSQGVEEPFPLGFLRDKWHLLDGDWNPQHRHLSVPLRNPRDRDLNPPLENKNKLKSCNPTTAPSFGGLAWGHTGLFLLSLALVFLLSKALRRKILGKQTHPKQNHVRKCQWILQDRTWYVGSPFFGAGSSNSEPSGKVFRVAKTRSRLFLGDKFFIWGGKEPPRSCSVWQRFCFAVFIHPALPKLCCFDFSLLNEVYLPWQKGSFLALVG